MKEVTYVVGVFLCETIVVSHMIPVETVSHKLQKMKRGSSRFNMIEKFHRRTEHTTKKSNKQPVLDTVV